MKYFANWIPLNTNVSFNRNPDLKDSVSRPEATGKGILTLGCNNGGGGGNFSKVKQIVAKWEGTRKRLFSSFFAGVVILEI